MLNAIIRFALRQRMLVLAAALLVTGYGSYLALNTPIDVFPDLNRPRVVVMTEAPGLSPEEVESLITFPIETASEWGEWCRSRPQFVWGRHFGDLRGVWIQHRHLQRSASRQRATAAHAGPTAGRRNSTVGSDLVDHGPDFDARECTAMADKTDPLELRTLADWVVRQRLLTIPGVAQVFTMGGSRKQFQVLVNPEELLRFGVSLQQVKDAVVNSNENATGGYLDQQGPNELLVRALGRVQND